MAISNYQSEPLRFFIISMKMVTLILRKWPREDSLLTKQTLLIYTIPSVYNTNLTMNVVPLDLSLDLSKSIHI